LALTPGTRLGLYEVIAQIGAGGMGEVYRATDTRLKREVAVKIIPSALAADPDRLARFQREAEVLASLNHPHIAAIYGVEESQGGRALVMELVEGDDLSQRIARGAIPIDEALPIAKQIAEALEAAHEQGIVHRDLKPANVKVRPDGSVKVLDFGLAKALEPTGPKSPNVSGSPTITTPAMTQMGMVLGTAAYMSPEQAKGRVADTRSDIWAFGCVLYEMLSGRRAFAGDDVSEVMASVIRSDPDWTALPPSTPSRLRELLQRCLQKDAKRRLRHIGDARIEIEETMARPDPARVGARAPGGPYFAWAVATVFAALAAVGWWNAARATSSSPAPIVARFALALPSRAPMELEGPWPFLTISPDGRAIAFVAHLGSGARLLYVRRIDGFDAQPLPGTDGAFSPFFSPDSQWIAFFANGKLKKVPAAGGTPRAIADAASDDNGSWSDDGTILVGGGTGISRLSPDGSHRELISKLEAGETSHAFPHALPDGRTVLFTIQRGDMTSYDDGRIAVQTTGGPRRVVLEGGASGSYVPSGHIVYARGGSIMAVAFDPRRLAVIGQPAEVVQGGMFDQFSGAARFAVAGAGTLVYAPGGPVPIAELSLQWQDRRGAIQPIDAPRRFYADPHFSPDGRVIAFTVRAANDDVWAYDTTRQAFTRLTFTQGNNQWPVWSPDSERVTYRNDRDKTATLYSRRADGSGAEERLTTGSYEQTPGSWSSDGRVLAYTELRPGQGLNLAILSMDGGRTTRNLIDTPYNESNPMFSPDGHFIAYESDETGQREVFVSPFPGPGRKWQVSNGGGFSPQWTRRGQELLYRNGDRILTVTVTTTPFQLTSPRELLVLPPRTTEFAAAPDGERLMLIHRDGADLVAPQLHVVLNWLDELKRLVPVK
jgi:Tol biopolymer transport system component